MGLILLKIKNCNKIIDQNETILKILIKRTKIKLYNKTQIKEMNNFLFSEMKCLLYIIIEMFIKRKLYKAM